MVSSLIGLVVGGPCAPHTDSYGPGIHLHLVSPQEYLLRVQRGNNSWNVLRRYNDFDKLHKCLRISGIDLPLPGKRIFGNMRPDFIAERKEALQVYINEILMNPILASSLPAKRFVDPESYSQSFHGA